MNNIQLMPALKVNIIIVHPRGVVFPGALAMNHEQIYKLISKHTWNYLVKGHHLYTGT